MSKIDRNAVTFRKRRDDDGDFLYELYASTREEEMKVVPWTDAQKEQFVRMQFRAQTVHYDNYYDPDQFFIIEEDGRPIGRLYLERKPGETHIIDITLVPQKRGGGLGTMLLQELIDEAAAQGSSVLIHVEHFNPALHLYNRLGFVHVATDGVYYLMKREPSNRLS